MANRIEVTSDQLEKLREVNQALEGTNICNRYRMYMSCKDDKGRWFDIGWSYPYSAPEGAFLKRVKMFVYLMVPSSVTHIDEFERYLVTDAVAELFGWNLEEI